MEWDEWQLVNALVQPRWARALNEHNYVLGMVTHCEPTGVTVLFTQERFPNQSWWRYTPITLLGAPTRAVEHCMLHNTRTA